MGKRLALAMVLIALSAVTARAQSTVINEQGTSGAPVSAGACSGGATEVLGSFVTATSWSLMPEGADIRCTLRTAANGAASPVPTATVGFLFKSNVLVGEATLNLGSGVARLGLDCCGVSGAVSVDTWHE